MTMDDQALMDRALKLAEDQIGAALERVEACIERDNTRGKALSNARREARADARRARAEARLAVGCIRRHVHVKCRDARRARTEEARNKARAEAQAQSENARVWLQRGLAREAHECRRKPRPDTTGIVLTLDNIFSA